MMEEIKRGKKRKARYYAFEFLTVFAGITVAFLLNTWSENRKDKHTETKILTEIRNGLQLDTADIRENVYGHQRGIEACAYFRDLIDNKELPDRTADEQFFLLLRDFISIQNKSGYESLKSKGLELISDDSLRLEIIAMYDFHFQVLEKLEESYVENQFYDNYFESISKLLAESFQYDESGKLVDFKQPVQLTDAERNLFLTYLSKIESNRRYIVRYYRIVNEAAVSLIQHINRELED